MATRSLFLSKIKDQICLHPFDAVEGTVDTGKGDGVLMLLYRCNKLQVIVMIVGGKYLVMSIFLKK